MKKKNSIFTRNRLLLFFSSLLVSLSIAEIVLWTMPPLGPEMVLASTTGEIGHGLFTIDDDLRYVTVPGATTDAVTLNQLGIRGPDLGPKANGEQRVLVVGDSFTMGLQVENGETFSDLLNDQLGPTVQVMNAGVAGYGTAQATGWMRRLAKSSSADAAILTFYSGNDLRENSIWGRPQPFVHSPPPTRSRFITALAQYSRIVSYSLMSIDLHNQSSDFRIEMFKEEILPFADPEALSEIIRPTRAALQGFDDACTELKLICGVAIVPPAYVVHTERVRRTWQAFGLDPNTTNLEGPANAIRRVIPQHLPTIDLTSALQAREGEEPYLVFDPHFSREGHQITADAMAPFVTRLLTPPN